jgi:hypothetical protein
MTSYIRAKYFLKLIPMALILLGCFESKSKSFNWTGQVTSIDISDYGNTFCTIEFSNNNKYVSLLWLSTGKNENGPQASVIYDIDGNKITDAFDTNGYLVPKYLKLFSKIITKMSNTYYWPQNEKIKFLAPNEDFLNNAKWWFFSDNFSTCLKLVNPRSAEDGNKLKLNESGGEIICTAELWKMLPKKQLLWSIDLPEELSDIEEGGFFQNGENNYILIVYNLEKAIVLSQDNGKLLYAFNYNRDQSSIERSLYYKDEIAYRKLGLGFSASKAAFDPNNNILACGELTGARVRIFSLNQKGKLIFEANSNIEPHRPKGGVWRVNRVELASKGKYLIVEYLFAGRGTSKTYSVIEIYDTNTWSKVWVWKSSNNNIDICNVTISLDGEKMALIKTNGKSTQLQIGNFTKQTINTEDILFEQ